MRPIIPKDLLYTCSSRANCPRNVRYPPMYPRWEDQCRAFGYECRMISGRTWGHLWSLPPTVPYRSSKLTVSIFYNNNFTNCISFLSSVRRSFVIPWTERCGMIFEVNVVPAIFLSQPDFFFQLVLVVPFFFFYQPPRNVIFPELASRRLPIFAEAIIAHRPSNCPFEPVLLRLSFVSSFFTLGPPLWRAPPGISFFIPDPGYETRAWRTHTFRVRFVSPLARSSYSSHEFTGRFFRSAV